MLCGPDQAHRESKSAEVSQKLSDMDGFWRLNLNIYTIFLHNTYIYTFIYNTCTYISSFDPTQDSTQIPAHYLCWGYLREQPIQEPQGDHIAGCFHYHVIKNGIPDGPFPLHLWRHLCSVQLCTVRCTCTFDSSVWQRPIFPRTFFILIFLFWSVMVSLLLYFILHQCHLTINLNN